MQSFPRTRSEDNTSIIPATRTISSGPGCTSTTETTSSSRVGVARNITDVVNPGFKKLSAKGVVFNSPMSRSKYTYGATLTGYCHQRPLNCSTGSGAWKDDFTNLLGWKLGPLNGESIPATLPSGDLIKSACTKALAGVKNPSVQGIAFLGEIQQTLNLLKNPIQATTDYLIQMRRKASRPGGGSSTRSSSKDAARAVSSQHLAIMFGLRPFMMDIEGIIEALMKHMNERETSRGSASDSTMSTQSNLVLHLGGVLVDSRYKIVQEESITVRAGCLYAFSGRTLMDELGLSLRDIPSAAWELLPWSFVVDWFSNVGQIIAAVTASASNDFLAEWVSTTRKIKYTRTVTSTTLRNPNPDGWFISKACSDSDFVECEHYSRSPTSLGAHIGLVMNFDLSRTPILTALSLLIQQLTKR